jgi:hypothetical protein
MVDFLNILVGLLINLLSEALIFVTRLLLHQFFVLANYIIKGSILGHLEIWEYRQPWDASLGLGNLSCQSSLEVAIGSYDKRDNILHQSSKIELYRLLNLLAIDLILYFHDFFEEEVEVIVIVFIFTFILIVFLDHFFDECTSYWRSFWYSLKLLSKSFFKWLMSAVKEVINWSKS